MCLWHHADSTGSTRERHIYVIETGTQPDFAEGDFPHRAYLRQIVQLRAIPRHDVQNGYDNRRIAG